jgi:hypothetical protein
MAAATSAKNRWSPDWSHGTNTSVEVLDAITAVRCETRASTIESSDRDNHGAFNVLAAIGFWPKMRSNLPFDLTAIPGLITRSRMFPWRDCVLLCAVTIEWA